MLLLRILLQTSVEINIKIRSVYLKFMHMELLKTIPNWTRPQTAFFIIFILSSMSLPTRMSRVVQARNSSQQ